MPVEWTHMKSLWEGSRQDICQGWRTVSLMDLSLAVKTGLYYFVDSIRTQIVVMMWLPIMGDGASVVASRTPCDIGLFPGLVCASSWDLLGWCIALCLSFQTTLLRVNPSGFEATHATVTLELLWSLKCKIRMSTLWMFSGSWTL